MKVSGGPLGAGSYKTAWVIDDKPTHVLVTVASNGRQSLNAELQSLQILKRAGCRVVEVSEPIYDLPGGQIGVVMEKLDGFEVKETRFNMVTARTKILAAARGFGIAKACEQLKMVADFITNNGGISDLQFVVSGKSGMVLFDPATLGTNGGNESLTEMISYLQKEGEIGNQSLSASSSLKPVTG